jgi:hypothetical protein
MSDTFWLVFGGVVAIVLGVIIAVLTQGVWWIGGLIGLGVYLLILLMGFTGGDGGFTYIDIDFD